MRKSRFVGLEIHEKLSLKSKSGPSLKLSLLIRVQFYVKKDKLTLIGGLGGTKLELKGALGAPKEPQRPMTMFDLVSMGVVFWPGGPPKVT